MNICGKRGGLPFKEVTRLDYDTLKCPTGTQACSSKTNHENTICYPDDELKGSCPITGINFEQVKTGTTEYSYVL
jgi:hypothetical protein